MNETMKIESLPDGSYIATVGTNQKPFPDFDSAAKWAIEQLYGQEGDSDG